ncbi:MAG: hypothetical protein A2Y74_10050 [Actinobacteria bacterium RBG_13_63_9]|nr:MAG: hypothetical protein A2Y74_10050 [Actinobacteria bacterium RBG_13_63_9]
MSAAKARPRPKHAPQRTCVGCGSTSAKRELIRLVRTPAGEVEPDPTGKRPGRGAYLCHNPECWERAIKKGRLENALSTRLSPYDLETILRFRAERLRAELS